MSNRHIDKHLGKMAGWLGLTIIILSCETNKTPIITPPDPEFIWMRINDNEPATNDTMLWVNVTGQYLEWMKISDEDKFENKEWVQFDSLTIFQAPHIEGVFTLFGNFMTQSGTETEVFSDAIILDFSAEISLFDVAIDADTLRPGDQIEFSMETGEIGFASIRLGHLYQSLTPFPDGEGYYRNILTIPSIVINENASVIGTFTDLAGNIATPIELDKIYSIRGPELNPVVVGRLYLGEESCDDIWYHRETCYVSAERKVHVIKVFDVTNPVYIEYIPTRHYSEGLVGDNDLLLIADNNPGMMICSIQTPEHPLELGYAGAWGLVKDVAIDNKFGYVATVGFGLFIYNLQSPVTPEWITNLPLNCEGEAICLNDTLVYVAGNGGIAIIDITDPLHSSVVSQLNIIEDSVTELIYYRGNLFLSTWYSGIYRINVEDPYNPVFVQEYTHLTGSTDLFVDPPFLFVSRGETLSIVNISNINELPILAEVGGLSSARSVYAHDGMVYVVEANSLVIIDMTQPG